MKIIFLVSGSIRSNFSYRPLTLARSLRGLGYDVSIIAPKADKYNNFIPEEISEIDGVKILQPFQCTTKRLEINLFPYIFGACKILLREKPDLVYIYKPTPISIIGLISKLFYRTKTIVDFDDLGSEVMKIEGHPWHQRALVGWSERLSAKYSDSLVVASSYLFEMYKTQFPKKPMRLIPNGVESLWFDQTLTDHALEQHSKRIVFMGSINRRNILDPLFDILPEIIKIHPDVSVLIIGDGQYLSYFKEKTELLHLSQNVTFTGWLPLEKAKSYLHAGDIGYNYMPDEPTTKAASNMKVPQYMACGVVPLVSDVGDLAATVDFGNAGYICKTTTESLKETLLHALEDVHRVHKSDIARAFATKELNWDTLAARLHNWIVPRGGGNKKVYVVATTVPGNVGGGEIRNYNLIKEMIAQADAKVEVFCISPKDIETERQKFESEISAQCHIVPSRPRSFLQTLRAIMIHHVPPYMEDFKSSGIGDVFRAACEKSLPDIVHIEQLHAYYCIKQHIPWLKKNGVKIIFDCHNIEFQSFEESLEIFSFPKRLVGTFLVPYLKKMEIKATRQSSAVLACSEKDAAFFRTYNPHTHLIPNGVDCGEFKINSNNGKPVLVWVGGVGYPPNADAIQFFVTNIYPRVQKQVPEITLLAIGVEKEWLDTLGVRDSSIQTLGFVPDVRLYLAQATIGICPVRYGSGTRIKIMTYMAAGLPVVSTTKGAEGVGYTPDDTICIADDPETFTEKIIQLLQNEVYREKIRINGHDFIQQNYDWNVIGKNVKSLYI